MPDDFDDDEGQQVATGYGAAQQQGAQQGFGPGDYPPDDEMEALQAANEYRKARRGLGRRPVEGIPGGPQMAPDEQAGMPDVGGEAMPTSFPGYSDPSQAGAGMQAPAEPGHGQRGTPVHPAVAAYPNQQHGEVDSFQAALHDRLRYLENLRRMVSSDPRMYHADGSASAALQQHLSQLYHEAGNLAQFIQRGGPQGQQLLNGPGMQPQYSPIQKRRLAQLDEAEQKIINGDFDGKDLVQARQLIQQERQKVGPPQVQTSPWAADRGPGTTWTEPTPDGKAYLSHTRDMHGNIKTTVIKGEKQQAQQPDFKVSDVHKHMEMTGKSFADSIAEMKGGVPPGQDTQQAFNAKQVKEDHDLQRFAMQHSLAQNKPQKDAQTGNAPDMDFDKVQQHAEEIYKRMGGRGKFGMPLDQANKPPSAPVAQIARVSQAAATKQDTFGQMAAQSVQKLMAAHPGGLMTIPPAQRRMAVYYLKHLQKHDPSIKVGDYKDYGVEAPEVR